MIGKPKVRIAGAGALGLCSALALAEAGCRVEVFDPADEADNASGVAAGMLAPAFETVLDPASEGHFEIYRQGRDLWPALAAKTGVVLDRGGALWVGDPARAAAHDEALRALGLSPMLLDKAALSERAPGLSPELAAGVYTEADWRLDARQAIAALRLSALSAGVIFHSTRVPEGGEGVLVVATGASRDLTDRAPELARLTPIKGHILRLAVRAPARLVVRGEGVYIAPGGDSCIVGATMEAGLDDRTVDPAHAEILARRAAGLFPALAGCPYAVQTGVRGATPDGLPMVGASAAPDVVLAVGARRNGWLLAPLVARIVTATVLGDTVGPLGERFDPARLRDL